MYYFLPRKSIFACISTYIHSKIFPCEGSNPARGLKYPNVIPHFFKNYFGIWVAKKPDISGFFLHVILLVMLIWLKTLILIQCTLLIVGRVHFLLLESYRFLIEIGVGSNQLYDLVIEFFYDIIPMKGRLSFKSGNSHFEIILHIALN